MPSNMSRHEPTSCRSVVCVWPVVICTHDRTSDSQRSWRKRDRARNRVNRAGRVPNANPLQASWEGKLSHHSLESAISALQPSGGHESVRADGRRMSMCLALIQLAPERTLQRPLESLRDMWFSELEGPFWQRYNWNVIATRPLENFLCVSNIQNSRGKDAAPVLFSLGNSSRAAMQSSVTPILEEWLHEGLLTNLPSVSCTVALPTVLCLLLSSRVLRYFGVSMRRSLPACLTGSQMQLSSLKHRAKLQAESRAIVAQRPQPPGPSSGLSAGGFRNCVEVLDGWKDLLASALVGNPDRQHQVVQEFNMVRGWAARLAFELNPLKVAASKIEGSELQQGGVLGKHQRQRVLRCPRKDHSGQGST